MKMPEQKKVTVPVELLKKYDRPGPRYTSYPTVPEWSNQIGPKEYRNALENLSGTTDTPLAIYVHIPFCHQRCYYCGCNTVITRNNNRIHNYLDSLCKEIENTVKVTGKNRKITQLHFGGGTPTFLDNKSFDRIIFCLKNNFNILDSAERSIEIDPRATSLEQLEYLALRGFNRLSIGVQDFDTSVLKAINRNQSEKKIAELLEYGRRLNFKGINFDLIYGLPHQTVPSFTETIKKTIALGPDRLAVYSFAYLPQLKTHQMKINPDDLPSTETKYALFANAVNLFNEAGYNQIGMDHFALPEDELSLAQAHGNLNRNFMGYTVKSAPDMLAFGMSSISYFDHTFFQNHSGLDSYSNAIEKDGFATYRGMKLSDGDLIRQYVITSLMCNFVLNYDTLKKRYGVEYHTYFEKEHRQLQPFFKDGFLEESPNALKITLLGRTFVRNIAMTYDAYLRAEKGRQKPVFSRTI